MSLFKMLMSNGRRLLLPVLTALLLSVFSVAPAFADYAYYFPCFSSSVSKGELIGLALTNSSRLSADVAISIHDQNGVEKSVERWNLPPFGQKADVIGLGLDEVSGSFQVVSNRPLTGLCFLFANQMTVMYDMPMTQILKSKLYIPHAVQDAEWGMQIMVSNPNAQVVPVELTYSDPLGQKNAHAHTVTLAANGSAVIALEDILTSWELVAMPGGCLHLETDGTGVVAFATYDSLKSGGTYYAGILAVDPTLSVDNFTRSQYAVVSCSAPDYGSGAHALLEVEKPRSLQESLLPTISDIKMAAQGNCFYRIERYNGDSVTKFAAAAPATPIWQYSTMDMSDIVSSNPQTLIFSPATLTSDAKAYLPRFGSTRMWIVDPATTTEQGFKLGEVELGDYADSDGVPEMTKGVVVDGKLFLILQRIDRDNGFAPNNTSYLVVIDIETNEEIDTQAGGENFKGIPLPIKNPQEIVYNAATGKIFIQGVGNNFSFPAEYTGGIIAVDPSTYEVAMVVDDGDDTEHPYGNISGLAIISETKGYFVSYAGWGDNALYSFNPTTGVVDEDAVAAFPGGTATNIPAIGDDGQGMLWVCSSTTDGGLLTIINPADDSVDQEQTLNLNPQGIAFGTWE